MRENVPEGETWVYYNQNLEVHRQGTTSLFVTHMNEMEITDAVNILHNAFDHLDPKSREIPAIVDMEKPNSEGKRPHRISFYILRTFIHASFAKVHQKLYIKVLPSIMSLLNRSATIVCMNKKEVLRHMAQFKWS